MHLWHRMSRAGCRYVAATNIIAGVVIGFGPITLYMAKNGFHSASTEAGDCRDGSSVEMYATVPTVPGTAFNLNLNSGADVKAMPVSSQHASVLPVSRLIQRLP